MRLVATMLNIATLKDVYGSVRPPIYQNISFFFFQGLLQKFIFHSHLHGSTGSAPHLFHFEAKAKDAAPILDMLILRWREKKRLSDPQEGS